MQHREFGKTGKKLTLLGFGGMRFMEVGESDSANTVDEAAAVKMLRYAYDQGINYVDTAYIYNDGQSEVAIGKSLKDGYREKVYLADKMPVWLVKKPADLERIFDEQLARLDTSYIDFYLLHALNAETWETVQRLDIIAWCEEKKRQGLIKHIGFSFHDSFSVFKKIIDSYDWEFCQVQYNYMNEAVQAGTAGVEYAHSKGIPVVVMEPLLGGNLASLKAVAKCFKTTNRSQVEMALRWLWNKPEISLVLSGMSAMQQAVDNIEYAGRAGVGVMTDIEHAAIAEAQAIMKSRNVVPCTACRYCIDCPMKIDIPEIFSLYNTAKNAILGKQVGEAKDNYNALAVKADACIKCRACEQHCPQRIEITARLHEAHEFLYRAPKRKTPGA
ncbi:MAG: aldo/keto reductase [Bacillota bacterium]